MEQQRYGHITRWNILLDELCHRAGFLDTASLAGRFCELANNGRQRDFETTIRNLNNWRSGRHIPRLRSLRVLEQVLKVDEDPELLDRWNALYRQASEAEEDEELSVRPEIQAAAGGTNWSGRYRNWLNREVAATGVLLFLLGMGTGALLMSDWRPWGLLPADAPLVSYTPEFQIEVGESRIIHAERGDCGRLPRDWNGVAGALPASETGIFSDGGLARRNSKFCGGETPARAIMFTAIQPGVEEFLIQGDFFRVVVDEASAEVTTVTQ